MGIYKIRFWEASCDEPWQFVLVKAKDRADAKSKALGHFVSLGWQPDLIEPEITEWDTNSDILYSNVEEY